MDNNELKPTPAQELKEKLAATRVQYRVANKLVNDVQKFHDKFVSLRDVLTDKEAGVRANLALAAEHKKTMAQTLKDASAKLADIEKLSTTAQTQVDDLVDNYALFTETKDKVFDPATGFTALHDSATALKNSIEAFEKSASDAATTAGEKLDDIVKKNDAVVTAFDEFEKEKAKIDNPKTGFAAQLKLATEYAEAASEAKIRAESELATTTSLKERSEQLLEEITESKTEAQKQKDRSEELTADIANTLNKTSAYTLSKALQDRRKSLNGQLIFWGIVQFIAVALLIVGVGAVFYALFIHGTNGDSAEIAKRLMAPPSATSVISKALFTSPLVFFVYFTTSNFSHTRDLRDKYAWKETVSKNFQNYIKLMSDEFDDNIYEPARFKFAMRTVESIYQEPKNNPKRKKYNIGWNKIFNVGIEEEDLKDVVERSVEDAITDKVTNESVTQSKKPTSPVEEPVAAAEQRPTPETV